MIDSAAHHAVEMEDLSALRALLDAGADFQDPGPDGFTLLLHAIDIDIDSTVQTGRPLHVDMTAFLLARGAATTVGGVDLAAVADSQGGACGAACGAPRAGLCLGRPAQRARAVPPLR